MKSLEDLSAIHITRRVNLLATRQDRVDYLAVNITKRPRIVVSAYERKSVKVHRSQKRFN